MFSYVHLRDCSADKQQAVQNFVLLSQSDHILPDVLGFEVNGDQYVMLSVLGNEFQNFLDGRNPLTGKLWTEPTASVFSGA